LHEKGEVYFLFTVCFIKYKGGGFEIKRSIEGFTLFNLKVLKIYKMNRKYYFNNMKEEV